MYTYRKKSILFLKVENKELLIFPVLFVELAWKLYQKFVLCRFIHGSV
jgi:hypothetical protein